MIALALSQRTCVQHAVGETGPLVALKKEGRGGFEILSRWESEVLLSSKKALGKSCWQPAGVKGRVEGKRISVVVVSADQHLIRRFG